MTRRIEIENDAGRFVFAVDEEGTLVVTHNDAQRLVVVKEDAVLVAWLALFDEVLAIGADLDETDRAFRCEGERAGQLVQRVAETEARAEMFKAQLSRERARRLLIPTRCDRCGSERTAPIVCKGLSRETMGVIVVCCECEAFMPWRELTAEELKA